MIKFERLRELERQALNRSTMPAEVVTELESVPDDVQHDRLEAGTWASKP